MKEKNVCMCGHVWNVHGCLGSWDPTSPDPNGKGGYDGTCMDCECRGFRSRDEYREQKCAYCGHIPRNGDDCDTDVALRIKEDYHVCCYQHQLRGDGCL